MAETLAKVAAAMAVAREPWWVIGSAAVLLHGGATDVGDVDVLLSPDDARDVAAGFGIVARAGGAHPLFRSTLFFAYDGAPLAVEFMAGFAVASGGEWVAVEPRTRESVNIGGTSVFVPARNEMREMLARFGRPKDLERLAILPA